ncbi:MAG: DUF4363 family protein [Oscillospiraceae bacterium]|nr:DUF4363 family protein [Oscillospiraceae bacterium]
MTRLWIGVGLLVVLLLGGIALWMGIVPFHETLAQELDTAAELAVAGSWKQAQNTAFSARARWQRHQDRIAAVTDHEPMEQMEAMFQELSMLDSDRTVDFACICVHLAQTARAIGETQALKWWGIL